VSNLENQTNPFVSTWGPGRVEAGVVQPWNHPNPFFTWGPGGSGRVQPEPPKPVFNVDQGKGSGVFTGKPSFTWTRRRVSGGFYKVERQARKPVRSRDPMGFGTERIRTKSGPSPVDLGRGFFACSK